MKIVVVDDDPVARLLIEATLLSMGHQVVTFSDAESAWDALGRTAPSIVVSDWMMPGMDGLELCRRMRNSSDGQKVHFILVSSTLTSPQRERQAREAGVDQTLPKPAMPDELGRRIRSAELCLH